MMKKIEVPAGSEENYPIPIKSSGWLLSFLSIAAVTLYPSLYIYFTNAGEASFTDILSVSGILLLASFAISAILYAFIRDIPKSALITNIVMLFFLNFSFIEKGINLVLTAYYWHIAFLGAVILVCLGVFIYKKKCTEVAKKINLLLMIAFVGLICFNGIIAAPTIIKKVSDQKTETNLQVTAENAENQNMPNVYLCIFDEYAGLDCVQRYCGYDNSPFYQALRERGFNVSEHSGNQTISTTIEVPNMLNLDIVNFKNTLPAQRLENMKNPYLFQLMKANGYQLNIADVSGFIDTSDCKYQYNAGFVSTEGSAEYYILRNTAYYPFYNYKSSDEIGEIDNLFQYVGESASLQSSNLCTVAYFHTPHLPWIVDENGNAINGRDRSNYKDSSIYLGQFKYTTKKIQEMVDVILNNDPDSIIILLSDHGYRQPEHLKTWYGEQVDDMDLENTYMRNILCAVYFKGETIDIKDKSGINVLRTVLNRLLDTDFEMIDAPVSDDSEIGE